jgi:hypothetical protein
MHALPPAERSWTPVTKAAPKEYDDSAELEAALRGRHWRDVPRETLYAKRQELPLLTSEGFRFYLPAFLLAALDDEEIRFFLLCHFDVAANGGTLKQGLSKFSDGERAALRAFFEYMAEAPDQFVAPDHGEWRALAAAV